MSEFFGSADSIGIDALRRVILYSRAAFDIDEIVQQPAAQRCLTLAKAVKAASCSSAAAAAVVRSTSLMEILRNEAVLRQTGSASNLPPLLQPDGRARLASREGAGA